MKKSYHLTTHSIIFLTCTLVFSQLRAQDVSKPYFDGVKDVVTLVNGEPYAISISGITYGSLSPTATPITVRSNNPELIDKLEINSTSNGNAFIQYSLKENATGSAVFTVELEAIDANKKLLAFKRNFNLTVNSAVVEADKIKEMTNSIRLRSFPNPINEQGMIEFSTPQNDHVHIVLFDFQGRKIRQLYAGNTIANTTYRLALLQGQLSAGVYVLQLNALQAKKDIKLAVGE